MSFSSDELRVAAATAKSRDRRERKRALERKQRWLALPAVAGVALLIWFVTFDTPYEEAWFLAIGGFALLLPFVAAINERVK